MLSAAKYAKSVGCGSLNQVAEKSGMALTTLHDWARMTEGKKAAAKRYAFEAICEKVARDDKIDDALSLSIDEYIQRKIDDALKAK